MGYNNPTQFSRDHILTGKNRTKHKRSERGDNLIKLKTGQGSETKEIKEPLKNKINNNILICGTSGTGKSTLMQYLEEINQPKLKMIYKNEGEKSLSIDKNRPFVTNKRNNFLDSYNNSQSEKQIGYMLQQEAIFLEKITFKMLEEEEKYTIKSILKEITEEKKRSEKIDIPVLRMIENRIKHLYPSTKYTENNRYNQKISFDGMAEDEYLFFSDYILRNQYDELLNQIISIDEIHRLKPLLTGIINRITREVRSRGGLMATTQSLSDLPPSLINNFGTIYLFTTLDSRDLEFLERIEEKLPNLILNLEDHEFVEIRSYPKYRTKGYTYKMEIKTE